MKTGRPSDNTRGEPRGAAKNSKQRLRREFTAAGGWDVKKESPPHQANSKREPPRHGQDRRKRPRKAGDRGIPQPTRAGVPGERAPRLPRNGQTRSHSRKPDGPAANYEAPVNSDDSDAKEGNAKPLVPARSAAHDAPGGGALPAKADWRSKLRDTANDATIVHDFNSHSSLEKRKGDGPSLFLETNPAGLLKKGRCPCEERTAWEPSDPRWAATITRTFQALGGGGRRRIQMAPNP